MKSLVWCSFLLSVITYAMASEQATEVPVRSSRTGRKNYVWQPPRDYGDDGDDSDDKDDSPESGPGNRKSPAPVDFPSFGNYKGYDYGNYGPPPFVPNYKGYPLYPSFWKGGKPGDESSPVSPDQFMQMMMALNTEDSSKPEGLLSKLISDPKALAAISIIPLSVVAASVVPVLMNYYMTGMSTQMVSTTATNNKDARSLSGAGNLEMILENFALLARSVEKDECLQKSICKIASGNGDVSVPSYFLKAARTAANFVKEDWVNNLGVKTLVDGVKQGNCANVCNKLM